MEQRLPFSNDAERAVLGAMLKSEIARATVLGALSEDDFHVPGNKLIFRAIQTLSAGSRPLDMVILLEHLETHSLTDEAGGLVYVTELPRTIPVLSNLPNYIDIIKEKSTLRRLIAAAQEISDLAYSGKHELSYVLSEAEKQIYDISMQEVKRDLVPVKEAVVDSYVALGKIKGVGGVTGLPTGFADLDRLLSGLQRSDLIIVAARPGMGKTSFAMNIAQHVGLYRDAVAAVFSMEMSREQLIGRMLCSEARVDMQRMRNGQLTDEDWNKLTGVLNDFTKSTMYIDDTAGITLAEMNSKLRKLKMEAGRLDLVVIDYLQLMAYQGKAQNRQQEVSEMSRTLKIMARELDVPIVLLSQLSRMTEQRSTTNHRPVMSDLRESGAIEQDADVILLLYRESYYAEPEDALDNTIEVIVAKHRNGPTDTIKMMWQGEYTRFVSLAQD